MTERAVRANLTIRGRNYPVSEGLNLIGRCKRAAVVLRDSVISQQQAIITIVNETQHYISDCGSSNGTFLNKNRLIPLKLYELTDGCTVEFAGIRAGYEKIANDDACDFIRPGSNTQNYSESAFGANTELLEATVEETSASFTVDATKFDIHEMETQIIPHNGHDPQTDIHEIATQVLPESVVNRNIYRAAASNNEDDETDVTDNEEDKTDNHQDTVVEESVLESTVVTNRTVAEQSDDSNTSIDLMMHDTRCPDIENLTDLDERGSLELEASGNTGESELRVDLLRKRASNRIDSDSEEAKNSDSEDRLRLSQLKRRTRQLLTSDTEDELDEDNKQDVSKMDDSDIIPSTQDALVDEFCVNFQTPNLKETVAEKDKSQNTNSEGSVDGFKLGLTQFVSTQKANANSETDAQNSEDAEDNAKSPGERTDVNSCEDQGSSAAPVPDSQNGNDEIFFQPTQRVCDSSKADDDSVFLKPTQRIAKGPKSVESTDDEDEEDLFLMPTQKVSNMEIFEQQTQKIREVHAEGEEHVFVEPLSKPADEDQNIYDLPTQKVGTDADIFNQRTQMIDGEFSNQKEKVDIFLQPTQQVEQNTAKIQDVFMLPTQPCNNTDIFNMPTQKVNEEDDIYVRPTQEVASINDVESKIEAIFEAQAVKFAQSSTQRPANPLANIFKKIEESPQKDEQNPEVSTENQAANAKQAAKKIFTEDRNKKVTPTRNTKGRRSAVSNGKHKAERKTSVRRSKRAKLNTDEDLESVDEISSDSSSTTELLGAKKVPDSTVKKAVKSDKNEGVADEEIKVRAVRTRKRASKYTQAVESSPVANSKATRGKKVAEVTTPSTSDVVELKSCEAKTAIRRSARGIKSNDYNNATISTAKQNGQKVEEGSDEAEVSALKSAVKRKGNSAAKPETPVKRKKEANRKVSTMDCSSGSSSDVAATPRRRGRQLEIADVTTPETPERLKRVRKPRVVFTMFDSPELESAVRQLGGSMVDTVDAATVLVTESVKRTQKLLVAVGQGKPICSPEWLRQSKKEGKFLDPWEHILTDKEAEKKWKFSLRESLNRSQKAKLFEGYYVHLVVNNAVDVLKGAVEACGGQCYMKAPPKNSPAKYVIVSTEENFSKCMKFLKQNPKPMLVAAEAIFDGVLRQELHLEDHLLTT